MRLMRRYYCIPFTQHRRHANTIASTSHYLSYSQPLLSSIRTKKQSVLSSVSFDFIRGRNTPNPCRFYHSSRPCEKKYSHKSMEEAQKKLLETLIETKDDEEDDEEWDEHVKSLSLDDFQKVFLDLYDIESMNGTSKYSVSHHMHICIPHTR